MKLSIVIVNYKVDVQVLECIHSIIKSGFRKTLEIIVVDNSQSKNLQTALHQVDKKIIYIRNKENVGFGQANNIGFKESTGEYVFFLNPDTKVFKNSLTTLVAFLEANSKVAVAAPLLVDINNNPYALQGTCELTPLRALFGISFLNKLFPNNPISKKYWNLSWNKKANKKVDVVPGTAFVIRRSIFAKIGGFDKKLFLYFEEFDLAIRLKKGGYKSYIIPKAKVFHEWGASTAKLKTAEEVFKKSREYYFKKNFGVLNGGLTNLLLSFNKYHLALLVVIFIGAFLRFYKLGELMIFIGDQGWFYLSATEMLLTGKIPLIGIPSSVVWLHQGPLATYMIAIALFFGNMHPVAPAVLFAILDTSVIALVFYLGWKIFNIKTGLYAGLFYATSPLIVLSARMPYHTSPIPFFVCILFLILYTLRRNDRLLFSLVFITFGILLQLELSNIVLVAAIAVVFYVKKITLPFKKIVLALVSFSIGVLPFLLYDFSHSFIQTAGFPLWIVNRVRLFLGFTTSGNATFGNLPNALRTVSEQLTLLIYPLSMPVTFVLIAIILFAFLFFGLRKISKFGILYLAFAVFFPIIGYFIHAAPGAAYFPLLYPSVCILFGYSLASLTSRWRFFTFFFVALAGLNMYVLIKNDYFLVTNTSSNKVPSLDRSYGITWLLIDDAAKAIIAHAGNSDVNVIAGGFYAEFSSNLDNLKYLLGWRKANLSSESPLRYTVYSNRSELKQESAIIFENSFFVVTFENKK